MDSPIETGLKNSDDDSCGLLPHDANSSEEISSPVTPKSERIPLDFDFINGDSDRDYGSSCSELDSEAEAFYSSLNYHLVSPGTTDGLDSSEKQLSYGELMKRFLQCEEELKTTTLKLQESEQEVEILKDEDKKKNHIVLELQSQVVELQTQILESSFKAMNLANELEVSRQGLIASEAEKAKLQSDIDDGSLEKESFYSEVLEDQIRRYDEEKLEMQTREVKLQDEIKALKKDFVDLGVRYNMVRAEKVGLCDELERLEDDVISGDLRMEHMEQEVNNMRTECIGLESDVVEFKSMVKELEKQVELQRHVIEEGEEEKREAIRQLCFSLDHYKTGYKQISQFLSSKKHATMDL